MDVSNCRKQGREQPAVSGHKSDSFDLYPTELGNSEAGVLKISLAESLNILERLLGRKAVKQLLWIFVNLSLVQKFSKIKFHFLLKE